MSAGPVTNNFTSSFSMFDPPRSSFRFLRFSGCALAKAQFSLSLSLSLSLSALCHVSWSFVLSIKLLREKEEEDDRDMYTGILVWASAPVPVHVAERAPVGDQDVDLRSRWHSMLENCGLKLARDRRFVKCGRRLQHMSRLGAYSFCAVFQFRFINRNRNRRVQKERLSFERNNFYGNKIRKCLISN